ncbi:DNA polymerase III subunit gamma/tau [Candidatus Saccharibacteria bacterium]|nr:DNA polymerase III subunit gamma/tau [Candidatus Saccharibacteria bacterium]
MQALYRKYRPTKIEDVIGQEQVVKPLKNALKSGKFSHSYLFTGPRGCGKTSVARIFAHEVNHFPYQVEDSYTDIIEIDAASNTGVDNIRELREKATIAPSKGKFKVYIIDEVHMLSKSAFNALLKTLEEPPAHVIFIMATTDAYKVPITITSRAQVFNFNLAAPDVMLKHLQSIADKEKIDISKEALNIIVARGGGSFRDSISLLDQISTLSGDDHTTITETMVESALGLPNDQNCEALLQAYQAKDGNKITALLKTILNTGTKPEILAENLISKIITKPEVGLMPLLAKLPDVKNPFAEAKILLAFLGENTLVTNTKIATPTIAVSQPPNSKDEHKQPEIQKNITTPEKVSTATPVQAPKADAQFDWESYKESIRTVNIGIATTLEKCSSKLNGNTLQIITERKIHKTILKNANNSQVLQKFLPQGFSLQIVDSTEISANSKTYSQISDIMGDVTEVNANGVPF